jgi:acyl-CoA thioester hydrolase
MFPLQRSAAESGGAGGGKVLEANIEFRVRYAETDQMGVVYHTNYLVWCEMGRTELMRQLGTAYADLEREGVYLAVCEAQVRFKASARYDELIRVRTTLLRVRTRGVRFHYLVEKVGGPVLAVAETELICIDAEGIPRRIPEAVQRLLRGGVAESGQEGTIETSSGL